MGFKTIYHRLIKTVLLVLIWNSAYAQVLDSAQYSGIEDFAKREFAISILTTENNVLAVVLDENPSSIIISEYSSDKLQKLNEFSWSSSGENFKDLTIWYAEYYNNQIILLSTSFNSTKDTEFLWLTQLSTEGIELKTTLVEEYSYERRNINRTYELFKSPIENYIGISAVTENLNDYKFEISIHLMDKASNLLEQKIIQLPNIKKVDSPSSFMVTESGIVYFLNGLTDKKNEENSKIGLEKRLYQLFRYDSVNDKIKQYDVSIADKYISDVRMTLEENGDLYILGFYNNSFYKGTEGVFIMVIDDSSGEIKVSGKKQLDPRILADFYTEKQLRRETSIDDLYLDHIYLKENGNIVLIGEVFYVNQRMITSANGLNITTSKYYNFEEIIAIELTSNLGYIQHNTIYKKQKSTNFLSSYWGYSLLIDEHSDDFALMYNYINPKREKSSVTSTSPSRTSVWLQWGFSTEQIILDGYKDLRLCPLYNPVWNSEFAILQDRSEYGFLKLIPSN